MTISLKANFLRSGKPAADKKRSPKIKGRDEIFFSGEDLDCAKINPDYMLAWKSPAFKCVALYDRRLVPCVFFPEGDTKRLLEQTFSNSALPRREGQEFYMPPKFCTPENARDFMLFRKGYIEIWDKAAFELVPPEFKNIQNFEDLVIGHWAAGVLLTLEGPESLETTLQATHEI